jgi:hypothetical protein
MNHRARGSYGQKALTFVRRSRRAIARHLPNRSDLEVPDLGCRFRVAQLPALAPRSKHGVGVDFRLASDQAALPQVWPNLFAVARRENV